MTKIWLHKAINISVIAVFFWNKPRSVPFSFASTTTSLFLHIPLQSPPPPVPPLSPPHVPPQAQQGWHKAQANKPRRADSLAGVQVAAHLLASVPSTNTSVWGCLGFLICKQREFELSSLNKWKNRHESSGERFAASWADVGRDYNGQNNHKTSYWRLKKFPGVKNNIVKQLMNLIQNEKGCQEFNLGEHNFSSLFLFLNLLPLF